MSNNDINRSRGGQNRNLSIELLKFVAVIIVANSHMELLYGKYSILATGGSIGDCLFFFVSGFTLFLGRMGRFDNWYKRRISRIYPTIFAWMLICSCLDISHFDMKSVWLDGGGWFVSCIMIYYVILYFIRKFTPSKPLVPFALSVIAVLVWYMFEDKTTFFMYGSTYFKWCHYFLFMLLGAYVGNGTITINSNVRKDAIKFILSLFAFYAYFFAGTKLGVDIVIKLQILSLIPLLGVVFYAYKLCCAPGVSEFMNTRIGLCLRAIAGLCLESYIVQVALFTDKMNGIFPLNIPIMFAYIFIVAYLTRSLGIIFLQIFRKDDMDWKAVFRLVEK